MTWHYESSQKNSLPEEGGNKVGYKAHRQKVGAEKVVSEKVASENGCGKNPCQTARGKESCCEGHQGNNAIGVSARIIVEIPGKTRLHRDRRAEW